MFFLKKKVDWNRKETGSNDVNVQVACESRCNGYDLRERENEREGQQNSEEYVNYTRPGEGIEKTIYLAETWGVARWVGKRRRERERK